MLRLNFYCSLIPCAKQVRLRAGSGFGSLIIHSHRLSKLSRRLSIRAIRDEMDGETSKSPRGSWDPGLEIEVPFEQRPLHSIYTDPSTLNAELVNEYSSLKNGALYSWVEPGPGTFFLRLGGLWLAVFTVLGGPIAAASFNPSREPLKFMLAAATGTLFIVSLIVLRIYLGWSYVGDRRLSAIIPYEEIGWYDGQMWVKPPEILARDRLLGSYKVKPVVKLLKQTLVRTGALLVTAVMLFIFPTPVEDFLQTTFATNEHKLNAQAPKVSTRFNMRKEELLKLPVEVIADDDLAATVAEAADGRPVYCRDRFYRALAGGQYCKWEDLLK